MLQIFFCIFLFISPSAEAQTEMRAQFMPDNDLHLSLDQQNNEMTQVLFDQILNTVKDRFQPIVEQLGAQLIVHHYWNNPTVNASAMQRGNQWHLNMYGGLARHKTVTGDGFALVACHELGHHLAGVPFYRKRLAWAASEGQSDYFATIACGKLLWKDQDHENARAKVKVSALPGGALVIRRCDDSYAQQAERNLCYRLALAGKSLANLLATLGHGPLPQFDRPDPGRVATTTLHHPKAQCRLDTYLAGAYCRQQWDFSLIPGKEYSVREGIRAYIQAKPFACHRPENPLHARPRCWFAPNDIKRPELDILQSQRELEVHRDQSLTLGPIAVRPRQKLKVALRGDGDADLYVRMASQATEEHFDCRSFRFGSREQCQLEIPEGVSEVWAMVKGWSDRSQVTFTTAIQAKGQLCRNHGGGVGPQFRCWGDLSCRRIVEHNPQNQFNWCIMY